MRPLVPGDESLLLEAFAHLSPHSRYLRFFTPIHHLGDALLSHLTDVDTHDRFAWIALARDADGDQPVAVARYSRRGDRADAVEMALTVVDDYQGRGIGGQLVRLIALTALANGFSHLDGQVLAENAGMQQLLRNVGAEFHRAGGELVEFSVDLQALGQQIDGEPGTETLAALASTARRDR